VDYAEVIIRYTGRDGAVNRLRAAVAA